MLYCHECKLAWSNDGEYNLHMTRHHNYVVDAVEVEQRLSEAEQAIAHEKERHLKTAVFQEGRIARLQNRLRDAEAERDRLKAATNEVVFTAGKHIEELQADLSVAVEALTQSKRWLQTYPMTGGRQEAIRELDDALARISAAQEGPKEGGNDIDATS